MTKFSCIKVIDSKLGWNFFFLFFSLISEFFALRSLWEEENTNGKTEKKPLTMNTKNSIRQYARKNERKIEIWVRNNEKGGGGVERSPCSNSCQVFEQKIARFLSQIFSPFSFLYHYLFLFSIMSWKLVQFNVFLWFIYNKLRRCGPTNLIIDNLDVKPSVFDCRLQSDSDSNDEIATLI